MFMFKTPTKKERSSHFHIAMIKQVEKGLL